MPEQRLAYARATLAAPTNDDGPIRFVASQKRRNRYGFALRPDGWLLDNFRANPVFLWMHNPGQPPIGRVDVSQQAGDLLADVTFDRDDELARTVERKYRTGFLNAVSVGWGFVRKDGSPILDWWRLKPEEIASPEVFYDLEELSGVSVPGDPRAVRKQSAAAMASLGRELLELADTEVADMDDMVRVAVDRALDDRLGAALARLGVTLPASPHGPLPTAPAGSGNPAAATLTLTATTNQPAAAAGDPTDPPAGGEPADLFDQSAAQELLAALAP